MIFLRRWSDSQLTVSRSLPGYLLLLLLIACRREEKIQAEEVLIAKTVPNNYIKSGDSLFRMHEDTVYYGNEFFSGYRYTLYDNGDTAQLQSYFNGVEEGFQRKWFPGKKLAEERYYINGKKEGIHQGWWPNGKQKFYFTALHDEYRGEFREWYATGLLGKCFHYVNGREEGSQRLWWDNGTVRANYVIKNGRKYGLLGLKTCLNPYDSIYKK
jgi:antitoxin component YwqK of YwqJK toxin-antitoxin module